MIGLSPEERREAMKQVRAEVKQDTIPMTKTVWEGYVSPEVREFMDEWSDTDLANDETPDAAKQRAKNRNAAKNRRRAKSKHRQYWNRPTENEAIGKVVGKKRSK